MTHLPPTATPPRIRPRTGQRAAPASPCSPCVSGIGLHQSTRELAHRVLTSTLWVNLPWSFLYSQESQASGMLLVQRPRSLRLGNQRVVLTPPGFLCELLWWWVLDAGARRSSVHLREMDSPTAKCKETVKETDLGTEDKWNPKSR